MGKYRLIQDVLIGVFLKQVHPRLTVSLGWTKEVSFKLVDL